MCAKLTSLGLQNGAGLLAVSETSSDMRDLLEHETQDVRAAEAVALSCYHANKWVGVLPLRSLEWRRS
jgi:acetate kinase